MALVAAGLANKEIAAKLGCAEVTVEAHLTAVYRRASVESRVELLSRILSHC